MVAALQDPLPEQVAEGPLGTVLAGLLQKDPAQRLAPEEARRLLETAARADGDVTATLPAGRPAQGAPPVAPVVRSAAPPAAAAARAGHGEVDRTQALRPVQRGAATAPRDGEPDTGPPRRRLALVPLLVLLGLVVAGAVGVAALLGGPEGRPDVAAPTTSAPATSAPPPEPAGTPADEQPDEPDDGPGDGQGDGQGDDATADEPTRDDTPTTVQTPEDREGGDDDAGDLAPGLVAHEDDAYTVGVPEGWTGEEESGSRTRFRDPESRRYLLVEEGGTPSGDPVEDWEQQEPSVAQRLDGYELISIERGELRDFDVADWQFTWEPGGGTVRVLNRAVVDDDTDQAFALYWQVPVEEWDDSRALFDDIAASFAPTG